MVSPISLVRVVVCSDCLWECRYWVLSNAFTTLRFAWDVHCKCADIANAKACDAYRKVKSLRPIKAFRMFPILRLSQPMKRKNKIFVTIQSISFAHFILLQIQFTTMCLCQRLSSKNLLIFKSNQKKTKRNFFIAKLVKTIF